MKKFFIFLLSIILAILLSAFLAPILHQFLPFKFEKILNRLLMISAVVICFSFIQIDRNFLKVCGFSKHEHGIGRWVSGFLIAFLILSFLVWFESRVGALSFNSLFQWSFGLIISSLVTGLVVGIFEEFFFRGFVYLKLRSHISLWPTLLITNLFYSAVHFLKGGKPYISEAPTIFDSFRVLAASFQSFLAWHEFWPGFVGLFLFGLVLSFAFLRTRSLFLSMGLHSGAVFFLKLTNQWYQVNSAYSEFIFGGRGFYFGLFGWFFIGLIGLFVYLVTFRSQPDSR